ncbi:polyprenol phosphomannose-dependent alpha 1,6 mannosyltransferase MptB [Corynebacterium kozikiae]|uniref:polyprenol phosphomannose-dependent alpha 1,6 mannosyltransferase MptB n=1 Tax=Corynebacterium kozikiae TaxID=2968469 RepID=UPI00211B8FEA|nr:polyprenol phosphomannose-dependent alpha 1,6 mannosyltransferase MptB [Corynebacterium sp. 76QC2CO]
MRKRVREAARHLWSEAPQVGRAGSRSANLHVEVPTQRVFGLVATATGVDILQRAHLRYTDLRKFAFIRWLGTLGALLLGFGALGAGALPVVDNPYTSFPGGALMVRMMSASMMLCFVGVGCLVVAWVLLAPFTGAFLFPKQRDPGVVSVSMLRRTFLAWSLPILASAPMFTQDIYSYLANGSITRQGLDPYVAGPVDILGADDPLARSVPFIWANSPSPYGPVALGIAKIISIVTSDNVAWAVFAHRLCSILGVALAGWAIVALAKRCRVRPQAALWLGVLNPLTILHLIGGIHNEAILLGLMLCGLELGLRGAWRLETGLFPSAAAHIAASGLLISCAGMVKVTGFMALGFVGMVLARSLHARGLAKWWALTLAIACQILVLCLSIALVTWVSGIGLGWITSQGGAVTIRSWMSATTSVGVIFGWVGMVLGLGDHTEAILSVTRGVGIAAILAFTVRMLFAVLNGRIAAVGGLGVATFVLVVLFPVVHPWYALWAILPLAAWANRLLFQVGVLVYSVVVSFMVLPRGLSLPPLTVFTVYVGSFVALAILLAVLWWAFNARSRRRLH